MSSFFEAFQDCVRHIPRAPAVIHPAAAPAVTTYAELLDLVHGYAAELAACAPRSRLVPIFAGKSAQTIALSIACLASGRPFAWLSKRLRAPQIAAIARAASAESIVADATGLTVLREAIDGDPLLSKLLWLGVADGTRGSHERALAQAVGQLSSSVTVQVLGSDGSSYAPELEGIGASMLGCCLFTSGSTGGQKGVMIAEGDLTNRGLSEASWYNLRAGDRLLSLLPFSFDVGLNQMMSALLASVAIVICESWLPRDLDKIVAEQEIAGISAVPAIWRDWLAGGLRFDRARRHHALRYITVSGGSLSVEEQDRLQAVAPGVGVFKTYGQTETFRSTSLRPEEIETRPSSVGRAYPGTQVFVLNDAGAICAPGEVGEIVHSGLGTMLGYLGDASNAGKLRAIQFGRESKLAVFTGDYGYLDNTGYLYLKGRRDAMVKILGNRVYPEEAADQLRNLQGIREVEVVAAKSAYGEAELLGFVVCRDGTTLTPELIRRAAAQRLPAHMVPARIVVLKEIPRLSNGKPDRVALIERRATMHGV